MVKENFTNKRAKYCRDNFHRIDSEFVDVFEIINEYEIIEKQSLNNDTKILFDFIKILKNDETNKAKVECIYQKLLTAKNEFTR